MFCLVLEKGYFQGIHVEGVLMPKLMMSQYLGEGDGVLNFSSVQAFSTPLVALAVIRTGARLLQKINKQID